MMQMLDKHYSVIMMFKTLIKELYSLQQGSSKNIVEFEACLLQQVQILQPEYWGGDPARTLERDEAQLLL